MAGAAFDQLMRSKRKWEKGQIVIIYLSPSKPQNVPVEAGEEGCAPPAPDRPLNPQGCEDPDLVSNPDTRSFWMMPVDSFIVIINLSFLYHKPQKPAVTRID
jgi:hypothetical protein